MKHKLMKLIFDYHKPDNRGGYEREGWYEFNKQKFINLILLLGMGFAIFYICCCV